MKGISLLALFYDLGICNSYSRPRVSDDNPFIESWFKTLKYHISYPGKFQTLSKAREWFSTFIDFYNTSHSHSGSNFITPMQMRNDDYKEIAIKRDETMMKAYKKNPLRWSKHVKMLPQEHTVYLNLSADTRAR